MNLDREDNPRKARLSRNKSLIGSFVSTRPVGCLTSRAYQYPFRQMMMKQPKGRPVIEIETTSRPFHILSYSPFAVKDKPSVVVALL
jgi:hypothetical protein